MEEKDVTENAKDHVKNDHGCKITGTKNIDERRMEEIVNKEENNFRNPS